MEMNPVMVVLGIFLLIFLVGILKSISVIPENHRAGVVRLGKYIKTVGPGLHVSVPLIDLVTRVDLDASVPGWQGLSARELSAAVEHFVSVGSVTGEKYGRNRPASPATGGAPAGRGSTTATREEKALTAWLVKTAGEQLGVDLSNDSLAKSRIAESARGGIEELRSAGACEINLPFLTADQTGPKHFSCSLTLTQLEEIVSSSY